MNRLRRWLIKKLAGKESFIINADVDLVGEVNIDIDHLIGSLTCSGLKGDRQPKINIYTSKQLKEEK